MAFSLPATPALFLDAASPEVAVGWQTAAGTDAAWRTSREEAGVSLFRATEQLLREGRLTLADVRSVVFCEGPGSLLGIRLAAMAVRTWTALPRVAPLQVFAYRSLELVAADLLAANVVPPFAVIHDARRERWNILAVGAEGNFAAIRRGPTDELPAVAPQIFLPAEFPRWQPTPAGAREVAYRPARLPALAARFPLLRAAGAPDAFMTEMPTYRTWQPSPLPPPTA